MYLLISSLLLLQFALGFAGQAPLISPEVADRIGCVRANQISKTETIKSYRVTSEYSVNDEGELVKDWKYGFLDDFFPIVELGPELSADQRDRLLLLLGSPDTYDLNEMQDCKCCYIESDYGFEFCTSFGSRFVYISLRCGQMYFREADDSVMMSIWSDSEDLANFIGELFPEMAIRIK